MSNEDDQSKPRKVKISDPDEEPKTYINFYCCKLSLNIIYTICYVTAAVFLNIVNRIVFYTYNFNQYNFTFMLLQQLFCIVFFYFVSNYSEVFKSQAGEISFKDFARLKYYYISFATLFMFNTIIIFVGTQMIINASMFQTLRKLVLVKVYFIDLCCGYKKITGFTSICVFMVTIGGILSGVDTFSRDYVGIGITLISNFSCVAYNKYTEVFKRKTGVPNLKLLVYNSYISGPCLFALIFLSGEYKRLYLYFAEQRYLTGVNQEEGSFFGFVFFTAFSCTLVIILNSSFFMSNEKNSSMFTILLANTKDLFTSILSYFFLEGNKYTVNIVLGLLISTTGAVMFSSKSICDNMLTGEQKPEISNVNIQPQVVEIKIEDGENNQDN
jgi:drug/metabolite transporter (DMT)-like permease